MTYIRNERKRTCAYGGSDVLCDAVALRRTSQQHSTVCLHFCLFLSLSSHTLRPLPHGAVKESAQGVTIAAPFLSP